MPKKMIATVHILLDTEDENEAADIVSGLLTEQGIYEENSGILDWAYPRTEPHKYTGAQPVEIPDDYDRDENDLNDFAPPTA